MPWFRLDDSFHSHPKVIAAGNEAVGLYVRCGSYCAQHLTDGYIPEHVMLLYGSTPLVDTLVRTKLLRRAKGGWRMRDYLDYNPSAKDVQDLREKRADAGRKGGTASGNTRSKPQANASGLLQAKTNPHPGPIPAPPVVHVVNRVNADSNGRASPETIQAITNEIHDITGRHITDDWAQRVAEQILQGRHPASPAAYCRQAIRNDPDPHRRFLPLY